MDTTWLLAFPFAAPWIAAVIWCLLRTKPGDGALPPSMAELARRRFWS